MVSFILEKPNKAMKHEIRKIPTNVNYLSDWQDFDSILPRGKVILNKSICGCGCTEAYLRNDMPVILVSPRKELINCKVKKKNRLRPVHYFDRSNNNVDVKVTRDKLRQYLSTQQPGFVPKIMVTYDSLKIVLDFLVQLGLLTYFSIIVDEFPCIFTDAKIKGNVELTMIRRLNELSNHVIFISATPINDIYLDETSEFRNVPIYTLQWPEERYRKVWLNKQVMRSTREACSSVIQDFYAKGYFKSTIVDGVEVFSTEALFFLNSVVDIIAIIKKFKLTPDDATVICSEDDRNIIRLKEVGFDIGHASDELDYKTENKPFTFITKASFEGTDFYSDCSSTYVFADPGKENLSLDISIDLTQIAGRCRTETNPFRDMITYFYKTSKEKDIDRFEDEVNRRIKETSDFLFKYGNTNDTAFLKKLKSAQEKEKYKSDYIDVIESVDECGEPVLTMEGNIYAKLADLRGIEILRMQYKNNFSVFVTLQNNGFNTSNPLAGNNGNELNAFLSNFMSDNNFVRKMKLYVDFLEIHPELKPDVEAIPQIPMSYKDYYNNLSAKRIKELGYRERAITIEIAKERSHDNIKNVLTSILIPGKKYTSSALKSIIQQVYDNLKVLRTAKGTDIEEYIPSAKSISLTDKNGKRKKGYRI